MFAVLAILKFPVNETELMKLPNRMLAPPWAIVKSGVTPPGDDTKHRSAKDDEQRAH